MGRLSLGQVRVLLIIAGILVLVLTFFCIVQPNFNRAQSYDTKTEQANAEIKELQEMDATNADLESFTSLYMEGYDEFIESFPVKITQQKSIYLLYRLMISSGIDIQSISPTDSVPFYYMGNVVTSEGDRQSLQEEVAATELNEIDVVPLFEMIGSQASYTINLSGTTKQIYDCLDWISDNSEKMSVGDVNVQFDSSTGRLNGSITVNFYCLLGNGVPYEDPDVSGFTYGVDNVFGAFED